MLIDVPHTMKSVLCCHVHAQTRTFTKVSSIRLLRKASASQSFLHHETLASMTVEHSIGIGTLSLSLSQLYWPITTTPFTLYFSRKRIWIESAAILTVTGRYVGFVLFSFGWLVRCTNSVLIGEWTMPAKATRCTKIGHEKRKFLSRTRHPTMTPPFGLLPTDQPAAGGPLPEWIR